MERRAVHGPNARWQSHQWRLTEVLPWQAQHGPSGDARLLIDTDAVQSWLFADFTVSLFKDDAAGYALNLEASEPGFFVVWRMEESPQMADYPVAKPETVTLSYHDAGRWLDAQETVEQVPASAQVVAWMAAFTHEHHVPEVRKRKRPESFMRLEDRFGNPASVSTEKELDRMARMKREAGAGG